MLSGILFLVLVLAVAVLIAADVIRTPSDASAGQADRQLHMPAARGGSLPAFSREAARQEIPVPSGPAVMSFVDRPDEAALAFDQMHQEMSHSAASEAALRGRFNAMYVNLSRRSQALVERQLRLIESLEYGEQDQHRLTSLSKLNRIAMRMHRNSQNLLVLAGQEPSTSWNQPVTLAHLVEAALAEIEDYERITFEVQPDIAVRGPAVHDAVHLLVELIDNATAFSAAEMPVHITGRILSSGGALVDITDRGIGMSAKELAYVNQQLDNPPPPDIEVPKWMGLLVVARLAARHGIRIRLNPAEFGGLTALVWLPDEILTHYSAAVGSGYPAEQRGPAVTPPPLASVRPSPPAPPPTQPQPAWSASSAPATVRVDPPAAARLSGSGWLSVPGGDVGVAMPNAESQPGTRRLPIFDEVESRWSRDGRQVHAPPGPTPAAPGGPAMSGPVGLTPGPGGPAASGRAGLTTGGPAASGPAGLTTSPGPATATSPASGLPRRQSPAVQGPRAAPGTPPGAPSRPGAVGFRRGVSPGWPAPAEEASPDGQDES